MAVLEATPENFDELIQAEYAMVDFYGDHCGACAFTAPFYRQAADQMAYLKFIKVNTSAYPELGKRFDVVGLPTFLYFHRGQGDLSLHRRDESGRDPGAAGQVIVSIRQRR